MGVSDTRLGGSDTRTAMSAWERGGGRGGGEGQGGVRGRASSRRLWGCLWFFFVALVASSCVYRAGAFTGDQLNTSYNNAGGESGVIHPITPAFDGVDAAVLEGVLNGLRCVRDEFFCWCC